MKLQLNVLNVNDVKFAEKTKIADKVLYINRQELKDLLQQDKRLGEVDIEVTYPGESCRILQVADVVEPRAKISGSGGDFPGVLSKAGTAGDGKTCVLRGVAVIVNDQGGTLPESDRGISGEAEDAMGFIIDMSGPVAEENLYSKTRNVVVVPYPAKDASRDEYRIALKIASLKASVYLAQAGKELKPDEVEVYELPSLPEIAKGMEDLPKVAYNFMVYCSSYPTIVGEPVLYGDNIRVLLPTVVHPNAVFDGAIVNPYEGVGTETYVIQNHPVIKDLYHRHGKDLCFVGVILTVSRYTEPERERSVAMVADLAKYVLGADGIIITKSSSGAPDIDVAQTAQRCEDMGVKAVLIQFDRSAGTEVGAVFNLPGASAIVATANQTWSFDSPAVDRVIGRPVTLPSGILSDGELNNKRARTIKGILDQVGHSYVRPFRY